ncbi:MAG: hypothetical protein ACHQAV_03350 [Solirubrobacterales bacterium]
MSRGVAVSRRRASLTFAAAGLVAVAAQAVALAAPAPLPLTAKEYSTHGYTHNVSVSLVTSATDPKKIQAGPAPLGSQFAVGGIYARCPGAPKSAGITPFAGIAFPALTLRLSHGHYGFSKQLKVNQFLLASSLGKPVKLTVLFTGTVVSSTLIKGAVKISGSQCRSTAPYSAKPTTFAVAPGQ